MASVLCVGQAVQDFVFSLNAMPALPEKYRAEAFDSMGGGPAATAAVTVARLGGQALIAARLGDDNIAGLIAAELESYGVDCRLLRRFKGCRSSLSAVMLDRAGERLIVNYLDPGLPSDPAWLPEPAGLDVGAVLADTRWPQGAEAMLKAATAAGLPAVLDADKPIALDSALLPAASHVAFSAEGLADCTGLEDPAQGLALAGQCSNAWMCVTLGGEGVLVQADDRQHHVPAFKVTVKDTLGAGDVWHGAFALALAEGTGADAAVDFANAAAALKTQRPGGRRGVPMRAQVDQFIKQNRDGEQR
ncbi:MAG: sugar kinase [Sphingomonadales bacterium]